MLDASVVESEETVESPGKKSGTIELIDKEALMLEEMEAQAEAIVDDMMEQSCEVDAETGAPLDEICVDEAKRSGFRATVKGYVKSIERMVMRERSSAEDAAGVEEEAPKKRLTGDELEKGCE